MQGCGKIGTLYSIGGNSEWCNTMENSTEISQKKKKKTKLPCDPAIPLLGFYTKELKSWSQSDVSIPVFIPALFTIAKVWNLPKCPSIVEWIK